MGSTRSLLLQALLGDVVTTFKNGGTKAKQLYQNALAIDENCMDAVDGLVELYKDESKLPALCCISKRCIMGHDAVLYLEPCGS